MRKYIVCVCSILLLVGCSLSNSKDSDEDIFELFGDERDDIIGEVSENIMATIDRDQVEEYVEVIDSKAERDYQYPTNRYKITPSHGAGVIYIYDEDDEVIYRELVTFGIEEIMVDMKDEYTMRFSGIDALAVEAVETQMSNKLHSGVWEVGTDIEAGKYTVTGEGYGYLQIFDSTEETRVFEVIGNPYASSASEIELVEGQKLKINGVTEMGFEPIN